MLSRFVKRVTLLFIKNGIFKAEDEEIYAYGFELLFSTLLSLLAVLFLSLLFGKFLATLLFLAVFIVLRSFSGGYHASTHLRCFLILLITYGIFLTVLVFCPGAWYMGISGSFGVFSAAVIFLLSPVEDQNKPLSQNEIKIYQRRSRATSLLCLIIIMCGIVFFPKNELSLSVSCGMMSVAGSLLAVYVKNKNRQNTGFDV